MPEEEDNGELLDFPAESIGIEPQLLPKVLGRVPDDHPLKKSIRNLLVILGVVLIFAVLYSFIEPVLIGGRHHKGSDTIIEEEFRIEGKITYQDKIIDGWFLDEDRQHFMDAGGKRYTYVDPHLRESQRVSGHWRIND